MTTHLVTCEACSRQHEVAVRQAGESIDCACGARVAVPTLRQLRDMPVVAEDAPSLPSTGPPGAADWGVRQGLMVVLLVAALGLCGLAGYSWWTQPVLPEFQAEGWNQAVGEQIEHLSPAEAWEVWSLRYQPLRSSGFTPMEHPSSAAIRQELAARGRTRLVLLGLVGLLLLAAVACALAGWTGGRGARFEGPGG